jgi:hypothetical protein
VGDGETGSEDGVALNTYSRALASMQEKEVEAMDGVLDPRSRECGYERAQGGTTVGFRVHLSRR